MRMMMRQTISLALKTAPDIRFLLQAERKSPRTCEVRGLCHICCSKAR